MTTIIHEISRFFRKRLYQFVANVVVKIILILPVNFIPCITNNYACIILTCEYVQMLYGLIHHDIICLHCISAFVLHVQMSAPCTVASKIFETPLIQK